jgi:hypothetical protein
MKGYQMSKKDIEKIKELMIDLSFDCQRMSQSGLETYNELCILLDLETMEGR